MKIKITRQISVALAVLAQLGIGLDALASGLTITDPTPLYATNAPGIAVQAYIPALITTGPSAAYYQAGFNSWNNAQPTNAQWTMVYGGTNRGSFSISTYRAFLDGANFGGVTINIDYNPGAGDPPRINGNTNNTIENGEALWTQVIYTDAKLANSLPGNPYLDNPTSITNGVPPPMYPFQYGDSSFFDGPERAASAFWYAEAYLAAANFDTRTLTIYDGVSWGFTVTPEPGTMALAGLGAVLIFAFRRRR